MTGLGQNTGELCDKSRHCSTCGGYIMQWDGPLCGECSNARVAELEAENARLIRWASDCTAEIIDTLAAAGIDDYEQSTLDMVNAIIAENARLRKGLQAIIDHQKIVMGGTPEMFSTTARIAREALDK